MKVNIYAVDQNTGAQTLYARSVYLAGAMADADDSERQDAAEKLRTQGRAWIGGGAAPLFLLTLAKEGQQP